MPWETLENLGGLHFLQADLEGSNANFVFRKVVPRVSFTEELALDLISIGVLVKQLLLTGITNNNPAKLQGRGFAFHQVDDLVLGTLVYQIGFGKHTLCATSLGIALTRHLQNLLCGYVHICGDHGQHDRTRVAHVAEDHVLHQVHILLGSETIDRKSVV